jgi:hypothetical protein
MADETRGRQDEIQLFEDLYALLDADRSDRAAHWQQCRLALEHRRGALQGAIEPGIAELVIACVALGISTFGSCEGHDEIDNFNGPYPSPHLAFGWRRDQEADTEDEAEALRAREAEDVRLMAALLEEFYRGRERSPEHGIYMEQPPNGWPHDDIPGRGLEMGQPFWWGGEPVEERQIDDFGESHRSVYVRYPDGTDTKAKNMLSDDQRVLRYKKDVQERATLLPARQRELAEFAAFLTDIFFAGPEPDCSPELAALLETRFDGVRPGLAALDGAAATIGPRAAPELELG